MGHDQLFKDLLQTFFGDLLHIVLPGIAWHLDPARIRFLRDEHFTDLPVGRRRQVDLLAEVATRGGSPELVLVHVEIEARSHRRMARRLARYAMALHLRHAQPLVPMVV